MVAAVDSVVLLRPSEALLAAHPVTTIPNKHMHQINLYHFDNFGFHAGGEMLLDANATLTNIPTHNLGRRVMLWLLACNDRDFGVVTKRDLSRRIMYCENGAYYDRKVCPLAWPLRPTVADRASRSPYAASVRAHAVVAKPGVYRFLLTNCEVLGSRSGKTLRSEDVPRYCNGTEAVAGNYKECVAHLDPFPQNKLVVNFLNFTFMNPGGSFISSEDEPIIGLYLFFAVVWALLFLSWAANVAYWARHARGAKLVPLQWRMVAVPICKIAFVLWTWGFYREIRAGARIGELEGRAVPLGAALEFCYTVAFYDILLRIAKGWQITRPTIEWNEARTMHLANLFHAVADGFVRLLRSRTVATNLGVGEEAEGSDPSAGAASGGNAESLLRWCEMAYICSYCFILWCVWFSADRQMVALEWQLAVTEELGIAPRSTPIWTRFVMFRRFRTGFVLYLSVRVFGTLLLTKRYANSYHQGWGVAMIEEVAEFCFVASLMYTFRCKIFDPFFYAVPRMSDEMVEQARRRNERRRGFGDAPSRPTSLVPFFVAQDDEGHGDPALAAALAASAAEAAGNGGAGGGGRGTGGAPPGLNELPPGLGSQDSSGNLNWRQGMPLPAPPRGMLYPAGAGGGGSAVAHGPLVFKNPGDEVDTLGVVSTRSSLSSGSSSSRSNPPPV